MRKFDVSRIALAMVKKYGAGAGEVAIKRADILLERGDGQGFQDWLKVVEFVNEGQQTGLSRNIAP
jgi:hypothetical protein